MSCLSIEKRTYLGKVPIRTVRNIVVPISLEACINQRGKKEKKVGFFGKKNA